MPATKCFCGTDIAGVDTDEQVRVAVAHFRESHPDFAVNETQCRNFIERERQLTGPKERAESIGSVEILRVDAEQVDDVLRFFDHDAFADNPGWASCYCMAHHVPGGESGPNWADRSWQENREELAERIRSGRTTGVVAYDGGRVVAWCNASPRREFPDSARGDAEDDQVGTTACFMVAPSHRGHGLAGRMLAAALEMFRDTGLKAAEGHPAEDPQWAGAAYRGTVPLYEKAGFEPVPGSEKPLMRRKL